MSAPAARKEFVWRESVWIVMIVAKIAVFLTGVIITIYTLRSAVRVFVLSRGARDSLAAVVFVSIRRLFNLRLRRQQNYEDKDRLMAYYAPVSLLSLLPFWLALVLIGFTLMFWASGVSEWREAFTVSGSSLLTLGFARGDSFLHTVLAFFEATIGLVLVALLIAYLPTMYSAFSRRETKVNLLEARAGKPPSAVEMILRYHRNQGIEALHESWETWEEWFAQISESHTSLAALVFFRSPQPGHSWVTAAGTVLDAAALTLSILDIPWDARAAICIRSGYLAFQDIARFFNIPFNPDPRYPAEPISITREEFDDVYDRFQLAGIQVHADREQAWLDYAGWRVNYDAMLLSLAKMTLAPPAPWTSDRDPVSGKATVS